MAKQAHIYIYGDIYNDQSNDAGDIGLVNLRSVVDVINNNPNVDELLVHIHCRGGDVNEGFAIYDALINSGKTVITIVEGLCASIATVVALAGSVRKMNANSEFMIHNAWFDPFNMTGFNADDYEETAEFIRDADEKILALYAQITNGDSEILKIKMKEETHLTADEALELGFITAIVEPLKAVAFLPAKSLKSKNDKMSKLKALAAKAIAALTALAGVVQAAEATLADGSKVYYDGDLAVGTAVFSDSEMTAAVDDGDHTLEDGTVLTIVAGSVTVITEPAEEDIQALDTEALQARIADLEIENTALKAENTEAETQLNNINARLSKIQSTFVPPASGKNESKFRTQTANAQSTKKFINPKKGGTK